MLEYCISQRSGLLLVLSGEEGNELEAASDQGEQLEEVTPHLGGHLLVRGISFF